MVAARSKSRFSFDDLGPSPRRRPSRVGDLIKAEIATLLLRKIKDPRVQHVSITKVDVSPDLRNARVMFGVYGDQDPKEAAKGLESCKGFIRSTLARVLEMKYVPALQFKQDLSAQRQDEMERLFKEIRDENGSTSS